MDTFTERRLSKVTSPEMLSLVNRDIAHLKEVGFDKGVILSDIADMRRIMKSDILPQLKSRIFGQKGQNTKLLERHFSLIDAFHPYVLPPFDFAERDEILLEYFPEPMQRDSAKERLLEFDLPYEFCLLYMYGSAAFVTMEDGDLAATTFHPTLVSANTEVYPRATIVKQTTANDIFIQHTDLGENEVSFFTELSAVCELLALISHVRSTREVTILPMPEKIQQARIDRKKAPFPEIRIFSNKRIVYENPEHKGTHASPVPHDRDGTWCISKKGKRFWRKGAKVLGGAPEPIVTILKS